MSSIADIDFIWRESATTLNSNFARQISCIAAFCRRKCRTIAKNTKKLFRAANRGNIGCSRLFLEREVGEGSIDILLLGLENFAGEKESCHENYSHLSFKPPCLWHYPKFSYFRTTALTTCQSSIVTIVTPISHTTLQGKCNPMNSERVRKLINQLFLHSVRKTHCAGRKHKENVKFYYQKWMEDQVGSISFRF